MQRSKFLNNPLQQMNGFFDQSNITKLYSSVSDLAIIRSKVQVKSFTSKGGYKKKTISLPVYNWSII